MTVRIVYDTEGGHTYRDGEAHVPGVTTVLKPLSEAAYRGVPRDTLDRAAALGKAVHAMIHYDCKGTLDVDALDGPLRPYLEYWRAFRAQSGFEPIVSEHVVHSARYGYAGQIDLYGELNGERVHIDTKRCAALTLTVGPQTAAYGQALTEMGYAWNRRYALHLHGNTNAGWTLVPYKDPNDLRVFMASLTLYNYLKGKNKL